MELSQDERKRGFGAMDYHYKKNGIEILKEDDAARRTRLARYIVDAGEGKLSGSNIQRITNSKKEEGKTVRRRLILYAELCKEAAGDTGMMPVFWKWYPKHHQFSHLCEDQVRDCGNPMDHWCYADEDAIGHAVHIAESWHAKTLHRLVIEKHRIE